MGKKKVLILGGAGFIGSHLAEELLTREYEVSIFDHQYCSMKNIMHLQNDITFYSGDFNNTKDLEKIITKHQVIFHLISSTVPKNSVDNPVYDCESNLINTIKLLELLKVNYSGKIIFVSSGGTVYGIHNERIISEDHELNPISFYGLTKMNIEMYLKLYHYLYGLNYVVLRISNPYGERQSLVQGQGVIRHWLESIMKNGNINIWGDGNVIRDFIYIKDVVSAMVIVAESETEQRIYNIGSGTGLSLNDLKDVVRNVVEVDFEINYIASRKFDVPVNILDISRIRSQTSWHPKINIHDGIKITWNWLKSSVKN